MQLPTLKNNPDQQNELLKKGFGVVLSHRENGVLRGSGFLKALNTSPNTSVLENRAANFYSFKKELQHRPTLPL